MAFEAQIDKLIEKLTDLTRANKVIWQETADENSFLTGVGESVVIIGREKSFYTAPAFVRILSATGRTIKQAGLSGDQEEQERLRSLHELARSSAVKADKVVSDLLSTLEAIR